MKRPGGRRCKPANVTSRIAWAMFVRLVLWVVLWVVLGIHIGVKCFQCQSIEETDYAAYRAFRDDKSGGAGGIRLRHESGRTLASCPGHRRQPGRHAAVCADLRYGRRAGFAPHEQEDRADVDACENYRATDQPGRTLAGEHRRASGP